MMKHSTKELDDQLDRLHSVVESMLLAYDLYVDFDGDVDEKSERHAIMVGWIERLRAYNEGDGE